MRNKRTHTSALAFCRVIATAVLQLLDARLSSFANLSSVRRLVYMSSRAVQAAGAVDTLLLQWQCATAPDVRGDDGSDDDGSSVVLLAAAAGALCWLVVVVTLGWRRGRSSDTQRRSVPKPKVN
jgi:hypothetical protein